MESDIDSNGILCFKITNLTRKTSNTKKFDLKSLENLSFNDRDRLRQAVEKEQNLIDFEERRATKRLRAAEEENDPYKTTPFIYF